MRYLIPIVFVFVCAFAKYGFKQEQLKYSRVRNAYKEKESKLQVLFKAKGLSLSDCSLYLRAFKHEGALELWAKSKTHKTYTLIKSYAVCSKSGSIGPKRQQGDLQVPEGYYHINRFNPVSSYHLSLGLNYPNKSDRILGVKGKLGGDIFIHGECVTIGCLPMTNPLIKEIYVACVEAKNGGQLKIPVTVFPCKMTATNVKQLKGFKQHSKHFGLWDDLKKGYDYFNTNKKLPSIGFLANGRHTVS